MHCVSLFDWGFDWARSQFDWGILDTDALHCMSLVFSFFSPGVVFVVILGRAFFRFER